MLNLTPGKIIIKINAVIEIAVQLNMIGDLSWR